MYFSGFALHGEAHFFNAFLDDGEYVVSGFSYGAIKAFRAAVDTTKRLDKLQLFSPAFFQSKGEKFKRLQLLGYERDSDAYITKFSENCFLPYSVEPLQYSEHTTAQLKDLLEYKWSKEELQKLVERGTEIEVYLGSQDKISDVEAASAFFKPFATVTLIKGANHFLQGEVI